MIKADSTGSAAVNTKLVWIRITADAPAIGQKVQLINKGAGIATVGVHQRNSFFTHWQGLPVFGDDDGD